MTVQKPRRHWKRLQPSSLSHAMELCLEYAREVHNLSVDRAADRMGLANKWVIYKWMESGKLPAVQIRAFEHACGIDFVTRYLAHSAHKLLIDIPTGRRASNRDISELQGAIALAVGTLIEFYMDKSNAEDTVAVLTGVMEDLAWHRCNVEKQLQPDLNLEGDNA